MGCNSYSLLSLHHSLPIALYLFILPFPLLRSSFSYSFHCIFSFLFTFILSLLLAFTFLICCSYSFSVYAHSYVPLYTLSFLSAPPFSLSHTYSQFLTFFASCSFFLPPPTNFARSLILSRYPLHTTPSVTLSTSQSLSFFLTFHLSLSNFTGLSLAPSPSPIPITLYIVFVFILFAYVLVNILAVCRHSYSLALRLPFACPVISHVDVCALL